jgi:ketosteroid isomerase-like protein
VSQENVEIVRRSTEAIIRGDADAFIECCRPDVQWEENASGVFPGVRPVSRGHAALREWVSDVTDTWSDMRAERVDYLDPGDDRVVVDILFTARGSASGVETSLRFCSVFWLIDGKIARRQVFADRDHALKAVGLKE